MRILVTGGSGFIGSAVVKMLIARSVDVLNVDALTYASSPGALDSVSGASSYRFLKANICDTSFMKSALKEFQPNALIHLAAESHVDRSIDDPAKFIETNIVGTYSLLEAAREYWSSLNAKEKCGFRFLHVSTDEVYGDLQTSGSLFQESSSYKPSSPYSASKASSDHLVRSWYHTFGLPTLITHCSNNYGPFQNREKLIPLIISKALTGAELPVYGNGRQIRDWIFVDDHVQALLCVLESASPGETYNIGGATEKRNIDVVHAICDLLDELAPSKRNGISTFRDLITFVTDRPGHDYRYALDISKIKSDLGWIPNETFETGLRRTVEWYLKHLDSENCQ